MMNNTLYDKCCQRAFNKRKDKSVLLYNYWNKTFKGRFIDELFQLIMGTSSTVQQIYQLDTNIGNFINEFFTYYTYSISLHDSHRVPNNYK